MQCDILLMGVANVFLMQPVEISLQMHDDELMIMETERSHQYISVQMTSVMQLRSTSLRSV